MIFRVPALLAAALVASIPLTAQVAAKPPASAQASVDSLIAADRAFAAAGQQKPLVDALLPMFDAETIMPAPGGFVTGPEAIAAALKANPNNAGATMSWAPVRGGVSADGQQGFTIGYFTMSAAGKPDRRGKYVAYWIKRPAGWRVAVYKRAPRPDGDVSLELMAPSLPERALKPAKDPKILAGYKASLDKAERDFSDLSLKIGLGPAFVKNGRADATNLGAGPGFTVGNEKIGADIGTVTGPPIKWAPEDVITSATGDLGITWGFIRPVDPQAKAQPGGGPYTTIWRRAAPDQPWRYVAE